MLLQFSDLGYHFFAFAQTAKHSQTMDVRVAALQDHDIKTTTTMCSILLLLFLQ
jgi:hypothetical protein